jgi:hypothetical protein
MVLSEVCFMAFLMSGGEVVFRCESGLLCAITQVTSPGLEHTCNAHIEYEDLKLMIMNSSANFIFCIACLHVLLRRKFILGWQGRDLRRSAVMYMYDECCVTPRFDRHLPSMNRCSTRRKQYLIGHTETIISFQVSIYDALLT